MRYNRADINSAMNAAIKASSAGNPKFVYGTASGWVIADKKPPFKQNHYVVRGDRSSVDRVRFS